MIHHNPPSNANTCKADMLHKLRRPRWCTCLCVPGQGWIFIISLLHFHLLEVSRSSSWGDLCLPITILPLTPTSMVGGVSAEASAFRRWTSFVEQIPASALRLGCTAPQSLNCTSAQPRGLPVINISPTSIFKGSVEQDTHASDQRAATRRCEVCCRSLKSCCG